MEQTPNNPLDQIFGPCLMLNTYDCIKEMAQNNQKITKTSLAKFICKKKNIEINSEELEKLKQRLFYPLKNLEKIGSLTKNYELTEKKTNRAYYTYHK